ncbi:cytochrome bd oxidase small subunit CydS [Paenibacillus sp. FJAT-27812]
MEFFLIMIAPLLIVGMAIAFLFLWGAKGQTSPKK